ncbi:DUF192 domain-containing protein [Ramlibacter sp. Leaf400]|uniref:DUF192 domain-containing protein n=1 Tax=Ramlibacter sp. Leaf400 TaxID=1736365 RepID=UPI0007019000|nr:DUF192 domain-containing protein [Ramlibacter sp. Leaf400]KQT10898.1 hypothetical protein ASG30_08840 [Ramlibacter sp. Leaf400]
MKLARIASTLLLAAASAFAQEPQMDLPRVELSAGMHKIQAQRARTPSQTATGLMWRTQMPQHEGMLFEFPQAFQQCFWMKDTLIPLSAAFIEEDGTIANIADMQPRSLDSHCSTKPVRYVLEMNQGWFAKRGIKAGMKLAGPPFQK